MQDSDLLEEGSFAPLGDEELLAHFFGRAAEEQHDLNRRAAARAAGIAQAIAFARDRHWIYALAGDPAPEETAERCAVLEASARLLLSETVVRSLATAAARAQEHLPRLWERARTGFASIPQVDAAVALLVRFAGAELDDPASAVAEFDAALAEIALHASPASFRAKAMILARRLAPQPEAALHERALEDRKVVVEVSSDGMSWIRALIATQDAVAIKRRLTSTAKSMQTRERAGRTRDQLRADLVSAWLRGIGSTRPVTTKVLVTVPLDRLSPEARASVRTDAAPRVGIDLARESQLLGEGPLDDSTAVRLLLEAGAFTRVVTDPVTGVVLDMDRRSRFVTRAQREWLVLTHGICTRDGCRRSAAGAEIDHWREYAGPLRGPTDLENLHPFCAADHKLKGTTRMRYRRRDDGSVQLRSPTGFATTPDPWSMGSEPRYSPMLDRLLADGTQGEEPPF